MLKGDAYLRHTTFKDKKDKCATNRHVNVRIKIEIILNNKLFIKQNQLIQYENEIIVEQFFELLE